MVVVVLDQRAEVCARVCGNCVHGSRSHIMRGRIFNMLESSARVLSQAQPGFLDPSTVDALKTLAQAYDWTAYCNIEKTRVRMFERSCANWEIKNDGVL